MSDDVYEIRVHARPTWCQDCILLSRVVTTRSTPSGDSLVLARGGTVHALPADCDDAIPMCEAVSTTTRSAAVVASRS